jgi:succinate dehydrogenase / fumarate reductase membrane anchor subunit
MRLLTGLRAWAVQRASATLLLAFALWLGTRLLIAPPDGYAAWRAFVAQPAVSVAFAMALAALVGHAWVGVRDIVLDYVHSPSARAVLLLGTAVALLASGILLALALAALHVG